MAYWACTNCGYQIQATSPPEHCPGCEQSCIFNNVTCYRPECGGEQNIDPLLVGSVHKATQQATPQISPSPGLTMEALPPVYIFGNLTEEQRQRVIRLGHIETYEANAVICCQGSEAHKFYLVEEGQVAVECEFPNGTRRSITTVLSGGAFGWSALVRPYQLTATVVALSRSRVLAIERDALLTQMRSDPRMGLIIMQDIASVIASRLRSLELCGNSS